MKIPEVEDEIETLLSSAHSGLGGPAVAPASASTPSVNLYRRDKPAIAMVQGNFRITAPGTESDVHHIVLSFGSAVFPVLEGQSIGIVPPGTRADGWPHNIRLYSIASARDGEKRNANNVGLTVKRVEGGVASNYVCNLAVGDKVAVTGPFGATFLMPNDTQSNVIMICTGTGSAPFRAFTERRRRTASGAPGKFIMFFVRVRRRSCPTSVRFKKFLIACSKSTWCSREFRVQTRSTCKIGSALNTRRSRHCSRAQRPTSTSAA